MEQRRSQTLQVDLAESLERGTIHQLEDTVLERLSLHDLPAHFDRRVPVDLLLQIAG